MFVATALKGHRTGFSETGISCIRYHFPMPFYSSTRERRLWLLTLLIIAGIYLTLGIATTLVELSKLIPLIPIVGFLGGALAMLLVVLTQGLRVRPGGLELGVALGIAVVYYMVFLRMAIPERSHLFEYTIVGVFVYEALWERRSQGRFVPVPGIIAFIATSLVGLVDECIQYYLPSRHFEMDDIYFNCFAAFFAVLSMTVLRWVGRKFSLWGGEGERNSD